MMKRYREYDPNIVEAVQFTGENGDEIIKLLNVMGVFGLRLSESLTKIQAKSFISVY